MSCHDIQEKLNDYIEQELSEEQSRQIEMHLNTCPECREELSDLKVVLSLTRNLDEVEPPPFLAKRIMANVRELPAKKSLLNRLFFFSGTCPCGRPDSHNYSFLFFFYLYDRKAGRLYT